MHLREQAGFNDAVLSGLELPASDGKDHDDAAAAAGVALEELMPLFVVDTSPLHHQIPKLYRHVLHK